MTVRPSATQAHDAVELGPDGRPVPVLVLRRSLGELQHCVLAVGRTLGRLGVPVYAVRRGRTEPATMSRYISGGLDLNADATEQEWVDQLMGLDPHLSGAILLPIDDVSSVIVGDHREVLSSRFRLPQQPLGLPRRLASKLELAGLCRELDVPTPETVLLSSPEEAVRFTERFGYPVVLKRSVAWGGTVDAEGASVLIVGGPAELRPAYDRIRIQSPDDVPNVLAQEYIPGSSESVWIFNGYFDRESRCVSAFTGQKLRQCAHGAGQTTLGVCAHNQTVVDLASRLLEGVQYRGIVDMGFRFDARDGRYKLLDVNPRLGSTFRLFSAADGADVVRAMYLDLTGRPVPAAAAAPGRTWCDEPHDVVAAWRLVRARELSLGAWARSVGRATEFVWWAKDDPRPFLAMAASLPLQSLALLPSKRRAG
jgi:D-aspartate ligase